MELYFLGVDAGGSKTDAILLDTGGGDVRAIRLGPGNICSLGRAGCAVLLDEMCDRLLAGISPSAVTGSTFAFAGAGRESERALLRSVIAERGFGDFTVMTDAEILHYSFFGDTPGILIASGTGSVCLVSTQPGVYRQLGGWGYILGDEGSGFYVGRLAISDALDCRDHGRKPTRLTRELLRFYKVDSPEKLISLTYSSQSPQQLVASCARLVVELAERNDHDAMKVIDAAASALVELARKAVDVYTTAVSGKVNLALAGGILNADSVVARRFREMIAADNDHIEYFERQCSPAVAAVMYSAARCGYNLCQQERQKLSDANPNGIDQ
jgi:N-acetylglucosamine kinase-like BadF-type ATPase